jgi:hypothetical protein
MIKKNERPLTLYATRTIARLYEIQGYRNQAQAIYARLALPDDRPESVSTHMEAETNHTDRASFEQIVARMGQWIDLVGRHRFLAKNPDLP